jgi:hypothetical protein
MEADENAPDMPLWVLQDHPNVILQTRIYGKRPPGLGRGILWGKRFLKEHHCYRRQSKEEAAKEPTNSPQMVSTWDRCIC